MLIPRVAEPKKKFDIDIDHGVWSNSQRSGCPEIQGRMEGFTGAHVYCESPHFSFGWRLWAAGEFLALAITIMSWRWMKTSSAVEVESTLVMDGYTKQTHYLNGL